jgi:hypothetical protein
MCGLDLSTREGDGHVVVVLRGEPDIAGAATPLAAAREPQLIVNLAALRFPGSSGAVALARGRKQASSWSWPARVTSAARDRAGRRKEQGMDWIQTWRRVWSFGSFATS